MKTLLTLFSKGRSELQTEIDKATSLDQVVKLVQNRLDHLEKNYIGELSVTQVRLASFFLDTLRQSIATLTATNEAQLSPPQPQQSVNQATRFFPNRLILKILQGLICLGIFGSLFSLTRTAPGAWMAILLTLLLAGLEIVLQLDKSDRENIAAAPQSVATPQPIGRVDSQALLDNLADALNTIDLAVASAAKTHKPLDASGLEELPEVLNLLQRLMGASVLEKPQMALEIAKLLPQILMEQGIRAQIYQPDDTNSDREYFDFEPSIDHSSTEYITITPALLKGDRLLRRGRVIEPAYSEARE
ncbi:MAG TPA: hypothetical protein DDZ80_29620 [Cyanobacteria bacterium UBA8803]|nr:hypothetical protein [Cyanobacteria bacterium UBA9273]HBL62402.1 hypothetical protein [Cyanobacteria bacterium UBA8803]